MTRSEGTPSIDHEPGTGAGADMPPVADPARWSAAHLPPAQAARSTTLMILGVVAGLITVVVVSAVSGPIATKGAQMEPQRFRAQPAQAPAAIPAAAVTVATSAP